LITDDEYVRKKIRTIKIGDQVKITGVLSSYKNLKSGNTRGTSVTRDDQGNGACETIYVQDVHILSRYNSIWKVLMYVFLLILLMSLIMYFSAPYKARNS